MTNYTLKVGWLRSLTRSWAGHPLVDIMLTITVCLIWDRIATAAPGSASSRQIALQTMAAFCVGAIAFAVTGTSILLAVTPGQRVRKLLAEDGYEMLRLIMSAVISLTVAAIVLAVAIAFESERPGWFLPTIELAFALIGSMAQLRLVWIFYQIFALLAVDRPDPGEK